MFVIYTKNSCPYCIQAKQVMQSRGWNYEEKSISNPNVAKELRERAPSARTVPQIFLDDILIGGYTNLVEAIENNSLKPLMEQKGMSFLGREM